MGHYRVICPDLVTRHTSYFGTRLEATNFAEWGHACVAAAGHRIVNGVPEPTAAQRDALVRSCVDVGESSIRPDGVIVVRASHRHGAFLLLADGTKRG